MFDDARLGEIGDDAGDQGNDVLFLDGIAGDAGIDALAGVQDGDLGDIFNFFDASSFGSAGDDVGLDIFLDEDDLDQPLAALEKLGLLSISDFPELGKGKRFQRKDKTLNINEDDYWEGPERIAFMLIRDRVTKCFDPKANPEARVEAMTWVFAGHDSEEISFELCCTAVGVRAEIVRLRLQYQLLLKLQWFSNPLPESAVDLPDVLRGEIRYYTGDEGEELCRLIWWWPGIAARDLWESLSWSHEAAEYRRALEILEEKGVVSEWLDRYYLTGRNPQLNGIRKASSFRWSSLWAESE